MAQSWLSSRFRSEGGAPRWVPALLLGTSVVLLQPAHDVSGVSTAAGLTGTIKVEQATFRPDGPKHDRDVVIMLDPVKGPVPPTTSGRAQMDQRGLVFIPHVLAIQKGSTVKFLNNDREQHNVYFMDEQTGKTLDIGTYGPGVSTDHRFVTPGPVIVLCKLHLEMAAYIVVSESPWFTTVQLDPATRSASFSLKDVPAGEYRLTAWHKKLKQLGGPAAIVVPQSGTVDAPVVLTTASRAKQGR